MKLKIMVLGMLWTLAGCGHTDEIAADTNLDDTSASETINNGNAEESSTGTEAQETTGSTLTFTVYIDENCTQLPPRDSVVNLDTDNACNVAPNASMSDLVCYSDKITYNNYPNILDCSGEGIFNELLVGVCQQFPGPVPTWKYIEPSTYNCLTAEQ